MKKILVILIFVWAASLVRFGWADEEETPYAPPQVSPVEEAILEEEAKPITQEAQKEGELIAADQHTTQLRMNDIDRRLRRLEQENRYQADKIEYLEDKVSDLRRRYYRG